MKLKRLGPALLIAAGLLLMIMWSLPGLQPISQAQNGDDITIIKRLNKVGNVVRVGEVLSFTVALTNNSAFTLTHVTLVDEYDRTTLAFSRADPTQDSHNPATGVIIWDNVASPPIPPGAGLTLTLFFVAEHPKETVVNFARAQDITHTAGSISGTVETSRTQEAIGGAAPVYKYLSPPGSQPQTGWPVTFTHIITNDGLARLTRLPLTDTYPAMVFEFNYAIPPPDVFTPPGQLVWHDLTTYFGPITPLASVVVTTVFTATAQVDEAFNQASVEGAADEYNNDVAPGQGLVPIRIVAGPTTVTPTPIPKGGGDEADDDDEDEDEEEEQAAAPAPTFTPVILGVPTVAPTAIAAAAETGPRYLPETGQFQAGWWLPVLGLALVLAGIYLFRIKI